MPFLHFFLETLYMAVNLLGKAGITATMGSSGKELQLDIADFSESAMFEFFA